MEPHLLLLIFLPIIGFSAAVGQEPHMLRKSWGQVGVSCGGGGSSSNGSRWPGAPYVAQELGTGRWSCWQQQRQQQQ
jgi:hypothetical protein